MSNQNKPHVKYCGAKTRSGKPCKNPSMKNGRCRMHGGKSTGPKPENMRGNKNAEKHGLFSKYIPEETLDLMEEIETQSPSLILWNNIKIQYAAIIRAQKIMHVKNQNDLFKIEKSVSENVDGSRIEYEIQTAWDRNERFLNSQARAMTNLTNMITKYKELESADKEKALKLEKMEVEIQKLKGISEEVEDLSDVLGVIYGD